MASMKYVWKIIVRGALDENDACESYVLAGSMGEALELAGHLDAVAIPQINKTWPGSEGEYLPSARSSPRPNKIGH